MLEAIKAGQEFGRTREDVAERFKPPRVTRGRRILRRVFVRCAECGRVIIGWSIYQWPTHQREPCPRCGMLWRCRRGSG